MSRTIRVAAAQLGPVPAGPHPGSDAARAPVLKRLLALLEAAAGRGAQLVVFPELALTTFFPRAVLADAADVAAVFEPESPTQAAADGPHLKPLLDRAAALGVDVSIGYAERWTDADGHTTDYNTAIYYSAAARRVLQKYRKVHLPGQTAPRPADPAVAQQLEKYYFAPGNLPLAAFRAGGLVSSSEKTDPILGLLICNDRRWPETWRVLALQGVELVLCGYNTVDWKPQAAGTPQEQEALALLQHHISAQGGSYASACFSMHVAKAGLEDASVPGGGLIAGTVIYDPLGRKVAETTTKADELLVETLDLDLARGPKAGVFNFAAHRRVEHYRRIVDQVGVELP